MQNLNIKLYTDASGNLITQQSHSSSNLLHSLGTDNFTKFVSVEFLLDVNGNLMHDTVILKTDLKNELTRGEETKIKFPKDGTFTYYKFLIPKLSYFREIDSDYINNGEDVNSSTIVFSKQATQYNLTVGDVFYFSGMFYIVTSDINKLPVSEINTSNTEIIAITDIWDKQPYSVLSFQKIIFSFCNLQKCLLNLQKQILKSPNMYNNCGRIATNSTVIQHRDFLLNAVYVLEYLTCNNNFEEAQEIIDSIQDCSGNICNNNTFKTNCNCG